MRPPAQNQAPLPTAFEAKTDAELRELVVRLSANCSNCNLYPPCTIRRLSGLTYASLNNLTSRFGRKSCLEIVGEYYACPDHGLRCNATPAESFLAARFAASIGG